MKHLPQKIRAALIGGSQCGKTTLAKTHSLGYWKKYGLRSLVFDPWISEDPKFWGPHAWVTDEMEKFEHVVFSVKNCVVIWDEGTDNGGRDRDKLKFFTAIRHHHEALFFIGHLYSTMLPGMRGSLTDLFLFRSDPDEADKWAKITTEPELRAANTLEQWEYIHKTAFKPATRRKLTKDELKNGVTL